MTVYGDKNGKPVNEKETLKPTSIYGLGKKNAEKLLLRSNSPCLSVRIPGLYGNQRKSGLVYNIVQSLINNTELKLPQKPLLWAAMDVEDAAKVILKLCNTDWSGIKAINVSYPDKYSINKLVYLVTKILDKNINYTVEHPIFQYDLSLLKQIGIDINTSFENSLKLFVDKIV